MKMFISFLSLFVVHSVSAFEIKSLEQAYSILEVESAIERMDKVTLPECSAGTEYRRWIDVKFRNQTETFSGFLSSRTSYISQQEQCQQPQNHQYPRVHNNKYAPQLFYVPFGKSVEVEFKKLEEEITSEVETFGAGGPFLIIEGGTAWNRLQLMRYESKEISLRHESEDIKIKFAKNRRGDEMCFERLMTSGYSGYHTVTCVILL